MTVSQFVSNSSVWAAQLDYDDVLTSNTNVLQSSVYTGGNLTQGITVDVTSAAGNTGTWTYLIID